MVKLAQTAWPEIDSDVFQRPIVAHRPTRGSECAFGDLGLAIDVHTGHLKSLLPVLIIDLNVVALRGGEFNTTVITGSLALAKRASERDKDPSTKCICFIGISW